MKAIGNNIIIKIKKITTDKTKGGLFIIEKDREDIRYKEAVVFSVSDSISGIKKDDVIYYDKHAGHGVEFNKEKFIVIKLQDVVVVL
jgi:co-chaperonin GroES (HSP10)|tara:strand:+ start:1425 stop:1685 length:261 start_codon:yes stop_codon:yes gene_type:complete